MLDHALRAYFEEDDGSLPEVDIAFASDAGLLQAFDLLYSLSSANVASGEAHIHEREQARDRRFEGPEDARRMLAGQVDPFHVLLADIDVAGQRIPDLGVFVFPGRLCLDYRMGQAWTDARIDALLQLLVQLEALGGRVSVPGWEDSGEDEFRKAIEAL
ncbi:hypothetical protein [Noviluteimonas gilva]|uniref:Uncharacterized protein n=1 Tax=Noviluteimonas gilva TaxID=2682097 RepID=A0A7C9M3T3_9GAMM|nr:hypothetical protein [Lysobacter gilvus]MUV14646.1 hypothetical protein [Lysobacter gilvus]